MCFSYAILAPGSDISAQEARARYDMLNLIRKDKFDLILPQAMRDNNIDMWIHVMQRGDPDPLELDLGGTEGYFIFFDGDRERIERAVLGDRFTRVTDRDVYDIFGSADDLRQYVSARDPERIAVNMSGWLTVADGLSYTGYQKLAERLGEKYTRRLVSAENLITDFRVRRVQTEIVAFAKACEIQRRIMIAAFERITPGVTSREDIGWWAMDRVLEKGLATAYGADDVGPTMPKIIHSDISDLSETRKPGYIFQRGDLMSWDWGILYLNFGTDFKRYGYILKEGETELPSWIQHAWDRTLEVREIIRKTFKPGKTAGETLEIITKTVEESGFIYTPFTDTVKDRELIQSLGDSKKSGFSLDCHCVGNTGNSEVAVGPSLASFRPGRAHLFIQPNNLIAFEFVVHTWIPRFRKRLAVNYEDSAIVTEMGVEALYPRNEKIQVIR